MAKMSIKVDISQDLGVFLKNVVASIDKDGIKRMLLAAEHATGEIRRSAPHDRGGLIRSFKATMLTSQTLGILRSGGVSDLIYTKIQDEGGTITAKKKYLAIPVGDRARSVAGLWPRDWADGDLFFYTTKSGKPALAKRDGAPGKDFVQYVLRKNVKIKPTNYLKAAALNAEPEIAAILGDQIQISIDEVDK